MSNTNNLIEILRGGKLKIEDKDFREALHNFYLDKNSEKVNELLSVLVNSYPKNEKEKKRLKIALKKLDLISASADYLLGLKKLEINIGPIQDFYRDSVGIFPNKN